MTRRVPTPEEVYDTMTLQRSPPTSDDEAAPRPRGLPTPPPDLEVTRGLRHLINDGHLLCNPPISPSALRTLADGTVRALDLASRPRDTRPKRRRPDVFDLVAPTVSLGPGTRVAVARVLRVLGDEADAGGGEFADFYTRLACEALAFVADHLEPGDAFDTLRAAVRIRRV